MGIVDRKHDLKMFRRSSLRSPSGYEDGEQDACSESGSLGKSKASTTAYISAHSTDTGILTYNVK
jgi:hypothetical protein